LDRGIETAAFGLATLRAIPTDDAMIFAVVDYPIKLDESRAIIGR